MALSQANGEIAVETPGQGFIEITRAVADWLAECGAGDGLLTVFVRHTSASLTIQENADPSVRRDLADALARIAPEDHAYAHDQEGPDDMPAHIKAMVTPVSLAIPVTGGTPVLGTWQGVYLIEHRAASHRRRIALHFIGEIGGV